MSQYAALFERLRNYAAGVGPEAIEVISLIEAERDKLREALVAIRDMTQIQVDIREGEVYHHTQDMRRSVKMEAIARDALTPAKRG